MTKREREIVTRLANGEKLLRDDGRSYWWHDAAGMAIRKEQYVTSALMRKMFENGLVEIGRSDNDYRGRYIPTAFALAALADSE